MGADLYALVTEWAPAVAACRDAGGLDFFWDAEDLPYADEVDLPSGRGYYEAADYYEFVRPHLPAHLREPADAAFRMVVPGWGWDWLPDDRDDLSADAGVQCDGALIYALRPATAAAVHAIDLPWDELREIGERHPIPDERRAPPRQHMYMVLDWDDFEWRMRAHLDCVADAATTGRGVIAIVSQ